MSANYYVLCGENGVLIKGNISFMQAQRLLNRYFKGLRYVKKAASLAEARQICLNFAALQIQPVKIPRDIVPSEMVLFRNYPKLQNPMIFTDVICEGILSTNEF